jgi:hypothetical protein
VESSLSALLSASLASEAASLERLAVLEGGLSGVAQAAAAAQAALADAASQGAAAALLRTWFHLSPAGGWCICCSRQSTAAAAHKQQHHAQRGTCMHIQAAALGAPCLMCAAGLSQLSSAVAAGRLAVEGREAELREEINAALRNMRAYARDMEVSWRSCSLLDAL